MKAFFLSFFKDTWLSLHGFRSMRSVRLCNDDHERPYEKSSII